MEARKAWNLEYKRKREVWRERFTELFPEGAFAGKKVLELGVGNGKTLQKILLQKPRSIKAVDFSLIAIRLCKEKFAKEKSIEFLEADLKELPFKDSEFDVVVCFHTLAHLLRSERPKAIEEIKRVLKKRGKLLFEDFAVKDFRFGKGKEIEENTFQRGNGITYHYFTAKEVERLFEMQGKAVLIKKELRLAGQKVKRKEIKAEFTRK